MYKETNKKQTKGDEKGVRGETEVIVNKQKQTYVQKTNKKQTYVQRNKQKTNKGR